jgi:hypothetical protein
MLHQMPPLHILAIRLAFLTTAALSRNAIVAHTVPIQLRTSIKLNTRLSTWLIQSLSTAELRIPLDPNPQLSTTPQTRPGICNLRPATRLKKYTRLSSRSRRSKPGQHHPIINTRLAVLMQTIPANRVLDSQAPFQASSNVRIQRSRCTRQQPIAGPASTLRKRECVSASPDSRPRRIGRLLTSKSAGPTRHARSSVLGSYLESRRALRVL